ncbi:hypothetical protein TRICI_004102 [Trichomonascus ciferrii]|uniref:Uncharacterized protein n=1 Tax=Trichomonascus ciferrii TaxID=44093 RepID=A0A642V227_9ASCO|nr:hypothetical protein TRICI_004102 [Trichomonascus ciferrii]
MYEEDRRPHDHDPEVLEKIALKERGKEGEHLGNRLLPDLGAQSTCQKHDGDCNDNALGGPVDHAQIEHVCVVGLPGGEVHGNTGAEGGEDTRMGQPEPHARRLNQAT